MSECRVRMSVSALQVCLEPLEAGRKHWIPLELELGSVVSYHVVSRNQT